ncbi:MAG: hypothetical protein ACJ8C4_00405 [Gemmataceae bacterium]
MTRDDSIYEQLSAWQPHGDGPHLLRVTLPGGRLDLTAERADEMVCRLTDLRLTTGAVESCTAAQLTERAVKASEQVTALLEPLHVYEIDAGKSVAILRSANPTERNSELFYYELTLNGLYSADLKRFKAGKAEAGRSATPFVLTHEAVVKVVGDLVG